jgi:hypothetical protein
VIHNRIRRKRRNPIHNHNRIGHHYYHSDDEPNNLNCKQKVAP